MKSKRKEKFLPTPEEIKQFKDNLVKIPFNEIGMGFAEFSALLQYIKEDKFLVTPEGYMLSSIE